MAKIGKESGDFDPFEKGKQAFSSLNDVLGELDAPAKAKAAPQTIEEEAEDPAPKPATKRSQTTRRQAQPVAQGGGGGEEPIGSTTRDASAPAAPREGPKPVRAKKSKRFMATAEESADLDRAAIRLGAALGIRVDFSKLMRALLDVYARHEDDVLRNIPKNTAWERPSNLDPVGLAELEAELTDLIESGLSVALRRPPNARRGSR